MASPTATGAESAAAAATATARAESAAAAVTSAAGGVSAPAAVTSAAAVPGARTSRLKPAGRAMGLEALVALLAGLTGLFRPAEITGPCLRSGLRTSSGRVYVLVVSFR